jgi:2,3-dihydroxybenzoate decarboxylase
MTIKRITTEEAFTIPEIVEQTRKLVGGVPSMSTGAIVGPLVDLLCDIGQGRVMAMDKAGVDLQLLSLTAPGVQLYDAATALSLAQLANDRLKAAIDAHPTRFAGLAAVAPQDPAGSAKELERAITKLGLRGAIINSHTHGEYLDNPKFWPIFEAVTALDVPIYLHPREPSPAMAAPMNLPGFTVGWGFAVETGTHVLRLIANGVFDRFPKLRMVLGHLGEMLPFMLDRIDNRYRFETGLFPDKRMKRKPSEYFRNHFVVTTTGMNFATPLKAAIAVLGIDNVLFGIDHPYEDQSEEVAKFEAMGLSEADKKKLYQTNSERVFKL